MTDAEILAGIAQTEPLIRMTAGHRYQIRDTEDGPWRYVRSVTTILNEMAKPALINAAAKLAAASGDPHAHTKAWGAKAESGTNIHALLENEGRRLMGETVSDPSGISDEQLMAIARWKHWAGMSGLRPIAVELRVADFELGYAGTLDLLAYHQGALKVIDYKTGGRIWPESQLQLAAYRSAFKKRFGMEVAGLIVAIPQDGDSITEKACCEDISIEMEAFRGLLSVVKWRKSVEAA